MAWFATGRSLWAGYDAARRRRDQLRLCEVFAEFPETERASGFWWFRWGALRITQRTWFRRAQMPPPEKYAFNGRTHELNRALRGANLIRPSLYRGDRGRNQSHAILAGFMLARRCDRENDEARPVGPP